MNYSKLTKSLESFFESENKIIGKSESGENISAFHVGNKTGKQILLSASIHGREYVSSLLLLEIFNHWKKKKNSFGIWFVPLLNPDGVRISLDGIDWVESEKQKEFLKKANNNSDDFSLWKANIRAVDLNVNFDVGWGQGKQNVFNPKSENYVGEKPESESETKAILSFVNTQKIDISLAFHTKGEVIYYRDKTSKPLAKTISKLNNYQVIKTKNSHGGLSDYMTEKKHTPSVTIELGNDYLIHPLSEKNLPRIIKKNKKLIENLDKVFKNKKTPIV